MLVAGSAMFGIVLSGCGKPDRGTVPVTVSVIYQGKPVVDASISLLSEDGRYAVGTTDVQGLSRLFTYAPNDGALPGPYAVAIDKHETIFPDAPASAADDHGQSQSIRHIYHIPQKYADTATSGLSLEVVKGEKNDFSFELKD